MEKKIKIEKSLKMQSWSNEKQRKNIRIAGRTRVNSWMHDGELVWQNIRLLH